MNVDMSATVSAILTFSLPRPNLGNNVVDTIQQILLQALARCEGAPRPKHTSTLDTVHNLGILCQGQGRYRGRADVRSSTDRKGGRALARKEEALGPKHPAALNFRSNLSKILHRKDRTTAEV